MNRHQLDRKVAELNKMLGRPTVPYSREDKHDTTSRYIANVGCIWLEYNTHYGYKIVEMSNDSGGEKTLTEGLTLKAATEWVTGAYWIHQTLTEANRIANGEHTT